MEPILSQTELAAASVRNLSRGLCRPGGWHLFIFAVALLVIIPISVLALAWREPAWEIWQHLRSTLLSQLVLNSLTLVLGVTTGTLVLGISLAFLTAICDFPGRRLFSWMLLLPLAMPTYVLAFVFLGIFDFSGPVQTLLRELFGSAIRLPDMRSSAGIIIVLTLALYPYVYLLTRNAFKTQGKRALEAAASLGCSPARAFFRVILPMARPWIAAGATLVMMETLADFGAVSIFNYDTFTTAIYKTWFGFFSLPAAAQLSTLLIVPVLVLTLLEQKMRKRMRFSQNRLTAQQERIPLTGGKRWLATTFCSAVLFIAFIIPVLQLGIWSMKALDEELNDRYLVLLGHSVTLAISAALLICALSLLLGYAARQSRGRLTHALLRIATLGYALPGTVLAVGIFIPLAALDNFFIDTTRNLFGVEIMPLLQGSILIMLVAYTIRFIAPGFKTIDSAMHRITGNIDEAAQLMGLHGIKLITRVHLPILRSSIGTALTLIFVEVMKEMPITLMTRPFGWDTLAVKIFELTSEGEWERSSLAALALLAAGLLPIALTMRGSEKER